MTAIPDGRNSNAWRVLLICPDAVLAGEAEALLRGCLPTASATVLPEYPAAGAVSRVVQQHAPNLCLLEVGQNTEAAFGVLEALRAGDAGVPVVTLLPLDDADLILRCLRQGASDFLLWPLTAEQLQSVVERLRAPAGGGSLALGRVVSVVPAKGACGATTVACNLAYQVKRLGPERKVLLADLDPITGTIGFMWKLKSSYSFMDVLAHGSALDADVWKGVVVPSHGIDVLLAPELPAHGIDDGPGPASILDFARRNYAYVVADAGSAYGEWSRKIAELSDDVLLVATGDGQALYGAGRATDYLRRSGVNASKIRLVVNRQKQGVRVTEMQASHVIPSDPEALHKALVEGRAVPNSSAFGRQVAALAANLAGAADRDAAPGKKSGGVAGWFSLFGRKREGGRGGAGGKDEGRIKQLR